MKRAVLALFVISVLLAVPAVAQQTAGNINGRVLDEQGAAVPGATVTATEAATGFTRTVVSDATGTFKLTSLPVGTYDVRAELQGFQPLVSKGIIVNVSVTVTIDLKLSVAKLTEDVTVTGQTPLIETTSSSVGGVVDVNKIESMPLNGRQFANLAMTVGGVAMGFHSDPTKSSQYSPQVAGGNGRNVNYQIDGGDNNDDTVGGLLQLFPLEAIAQFNMITSRYKAEYGRSNGGVMNIVTKGGTNRFGGSFFTMMRDDAMNAETQTEKNYDAAQVAAGRPAPGKNDYRRYQFGGSFGGPISQNKAFFFVAAERTSQTGSQIVDTRGLFPQMDGPYPVPMDENLLTAKATFSLSPSQFLSVRYGANTNSQIYAVSAQRPPEGWGDSNNTFNSVNANYNWVLGGSKLNEFIFQYADFTNEITARSNAPQEAWPNGVTTGYNTNTPQTTIQRKWQLRDDFSWNVSGMGGIGHDFKTGVNIIYEPKLYITFNAGSGAYAYTHLDNDPAGKISAISLGSAGRPVNLPMNQYAFYIQDDWRVASRLTFNLGLRYDLVTGFAIDQTMVNNFNVLQAAGQAGRFAGMPGFEDWGKESKDDYNNIQPRIGAAWDVRGNGKDLVRGGYGIYYDFGYTNANILFAALNTVGGQGNQYQVSGYSNGVLNTNGAFFKVGDPISGVAAPNEAAPPPGPYYNNHVASPRILQPYTNQWSLGWSHELTKSTVLDIDYVGTRGHDLGVRWDLNTRINGGARRLADLALGPATPRFGLSVGGSKFDGITFVVRRRMEKHFSYNAWYMYSKATGLGGQGIDELTSQMVQDAADPFNDRQWGPAGRTDATHKVTASAVIEAPWGINVSPIFRYRSALPLHIWYGYDDNVDGANNDMYTKAYAFTGLDGNNRPTYKEIGDCTTINCGRGAAQHVLNLRVSKVFKMPRRMNFEVIGEVFNLYNALNPNFGIGPVTAGRIYTGTKAAPVANTSFMLPSAYAGDSGQTEQRVFQVGFRFTF